MSFATTRRHRQTDDPPGDDHIPPQLREAYAAIDADTEAKLIHRVHGITTIEHRGRMYRPAESPADFARVLHILKLEQAASVVNGQRVAAELAARDRQFHTCVVCGIAEAPNITGTGVARRLLPDGTAINAHAPCRDAVARLVDKHIDAEELPDGRTRADAARQFLEARR